MISFNENEILEPFIQSYILIIFSLCLSYNLMNLLHW